MGDDRRSIELERLPGGGFRATNVRGGTLTLGTGDRDEFSPVELLLVAIAGCSAVTVDAITARHAVPTRFEMEMSGRKVRDDQGQRLVDLLLELVAEFPEGEDGDRARERLPQAIRRTHEQVCTVSRTVQLGTPIEFVEA
ncbi:OsmC family protein [Nocardioides taihuensis]|uniref:OsmC family protein n=1 Tax=Nocardioides taihuensis TaxID=1835606 RepID=A0ABW0BIB3_9ACTN